MGEGEHDDALYPRPPRVPRPIEILDAQETELGQLVLRRRYSSSFDDLVYEVTLDGEFLMSSHVNASEIALARLGLDGARSGVDVDVVVGGLGLGHTALAALEHPNVGSVTIVELLEAVIGWHRDGIVPLGRRLCDDPRCRIVQGDFFELAADGGFDVDVILLDIDHSPEFLLHPRNRRFYEGDGLRRMASTLGDGATFALWSADAPSPELLDELGATFAAVRSEEIAFAVPQLDSEDRNWVVVANQ